MSEREQPQPTRWHDRRLIWNGLKIGLAIVLVYLVIAQIHLDDLRTMWRRISPLWIIASGTAFYITILLMARRYWQLIGREIAFQPILTLVIVQTMLGNLVATSAGAVSYVVMLRSRHQVDITFGVGSLVLARFGDLLALLVALVLTSWVLWNQIALLHALIVAVIVAMAALAIVFVLVGTLRQPIVAIIARMAGITRLDRIALIAQVINGLAGLAEQSPEQMRKQAIPFLLSSGAIMVSTLIFGYCMLRAFGVMLNPWYVVFVLTLTQLTTLVPIQVFGGLGLIDVTSLYIYALLGAPQTQIAPAIIGGRIAFYLLNALLLLYLPLDVRTRSQTAASPPAIEQQGPTKQL